MAKVIKGTQFNKYFKFRVERPYVELGKADVQDDIFFVLDEETFESLRNLSTTKTPKGTFSFCKSVKNLPPNQ